MAKTNKVCFLCGKKYHYCPTCSPDINKPSWYAMWCSEQCKDLDQILAAHTMNQITIEETKKKIEDLKLNNINFADKNVEKHYNEIMSYKIKDEETKEETKKVDDGNTTTTNSNSSEKTTSKAKVVNTRFQNDKKK